ncbi:MAG: putative secondary metabolism biosynthetic enzyme [Bogoriella megaspora]|nr:MAG: putative secondary metabolism biosynthetic enzyme [Bogoriella megaspora]
MAGGTRLLRSAYPQLLQVPRQNCTRGQLSFVNQRRTFIDEAFRPSIQTLTASRTLPYPHYLIYTIIADIDQYSSFLPYCASSTITQWSNPTRLYSRGGPESTSAREVCWPEEAELVIGWQNFQEAFTSRVYCIPGSVVEAVSGGTSTTLSGPDIAHHTIHDSSPPSNNNLLISHLLTRWTLRPHPYKPPPLPTHPSPSSPAPNKPAKPEEATTHPAKEQTEVNLSIEYAFANPVYAALSRTVAPKVAEMMIAAFEKRVKDVLDGPGQGMGGKGEKVGALEGLLRGGKP